MTEDYNDEIDLRELIISLWEQKLVIIISTIIATLIALIITLFIIKPSYKAKLDIVVNMPETYITKYGEYKLPIQSNKEYIDLIKSNDVLLKTMEDIDKDSAIESLINNIEILAPNGGKENAETLFKVSVSAETADESVILINKLYDNYLIYIDAMIKERTLVYFRNSFIEELNSQRISLENEVRTLEDNKELLKTTDKTIYQKSGINGENFNVTQDVLVIDNIINPNYTLLENHIIANNQNIKNFEKSIELLEANIKDINKDLDKFSLYHKNNDISEIDDVDSITSIVESSIYKVSEPALPSSKAKPNNALNILIGAVLGGGIGIMAALIKAYWIEPYNKHKEIEE